MTTETNYRGVPWSQLHWEAGAKCRRNGGIPVNNPWTPGTHAFESWRAGFEKENRKLADIAIELEPLPKGWNESPNGCWESHPKSGEICQLPDDGHTVHKRKHPNGLELECWR